MVKYKVRRKKELEPFINKTLHYNIIDDNKTIICSGSLHFKFFSKMYKFAKFLYDTYNGENIKVLIINNK